MSYHEEQYAVQGARGLGWASIGIGLTELLAPGQVQSMLGIEDRSSHRGILRVLGVRELLHGIAILAEDRPNRRMASSVWSRVAGDALDSALLGVAATKTSKPTSFAAVAAMVSAIGLFDVLCALKLSGHQLPQQITSAFRRSERFARPAAGVDVCRR